MALTRATDKIIANADGNLNLSGIVTAANFVGGGAGLTGLNVDASALKSGSDIKAQANSHGVVVTGVLTATSYSGDGSNLTNLPAGLGTALSSDQTSPLNKLYYTNEILSIASTITVDHPATGTGAYTQYADLRLEEDADLIIADGDDVIPNILGLGTDGGGLGAGGSGRIRVDQITNKNANGAPNFTNGLTATTGTFSGNLGVGGVLTYEDVTNVDSVGLITARSGVHVGPTAGVGATIYTDGGARFSGIVTATSFSGSGANLTGIDLGAVTGATGDFSIADKIVHTGDTNTAIRFPENDKISFETGGTERLRIADNGVKSSATFVDTSYHANPDPLGDGSGIVYYRLNDNFHDSGRFAQHGTSIQGGDPTFALVNSTGEKCWNNPTDGAINIPNLKNSYPFSMAAWVNLSSWPTSDNNGLIMNLNIGGQRVSLCIVKWSDRTTSDPGIMYGGSGHWIFAASSRPTNTWIHLVYSVVSSNNSGHAVYQNGSALSAIDKGGSHGGSAGYAIGGNAANGERFAIGRIGSIRFFNKALTASEANTLYTNDTFYTG